jgi:hypothetical protein
MRATGIPGGGFAYDLGHRGMGFVVAVGKIEAGDVHARLEQGLDYLDIAGSRPHGADDLGFTNYFHTVIDSYLVIITMAGAKVKLEAVGLWIFA